MFEESLIESTPLLRTHNRLPAIVSFTVQALLAASLIAIPLLHPQILPLHAPSLSFLPPMPRPAPPTPPPQLVHLTTGPASSISTPVPVMDRTASAHTLPGLTPVDNAPTISNLGIMTGTSPTGAFSLIPAATPGPHVVPAPTPTGSGTRPNISTGVAAGHLYAPIQPIYPPLALAAHMQGTVVVEAIISKSGQIESAHVTSGPPMLQSSALEAVRRARYHPFLLNGEPTEVATTISIYFRLGS